jgi:hypothetical protein
MDALATCMLNFSLSFYFFFFLEFRRLKKELKPPAARSVAMGPDGLRGGRLADGSSAARVPRSFNIFSFCLVLLSRAWKMPVWIPGLPLDL